MTNTADQVLMADGSVHFSQDGKRFTIKLKNKDQAISLFNSIKGTASIVLDGRTNDYFVMNSDSGMIRNFETVIKER